MAEIGLCSGLLWLVVLVLLVWHLTPREGASEPVEQVKDERLNQSWNYD